MKESEKAGLRWTFHPIVDVGVATLTAFADRNSPEEVTFDDLEGFARYAERAYFTPALSGYRTVLFTSNFINPSWPLEKQKEYVAEILRSFKLLPDSDLPKCAYCKRLSIRQPNSTLAFRDLVPLLTGRGVVNFFPLGRSGLPLCGLCTVAIQAIAIGAPMCSGKALVISSDVPFLTLALIKKWLPEIRARIQLAEATGQKPPNIGRPLTRAIEALLSLEKERLQWEDGAGITVFHISNSGQGPGVEIHELPSNILRFVMRAYGASYHSAWQDIIQRSWENIESEESKERKTSRKAKMKKAKIVNHLESRNFIFEDIFTLPDGAGKFIRTYFLQRPSGTRFNNDPRNNYKGWQDSKFIKWDLTKLFLKEVVGMEENRMEAIRKLGDRIAEEILNNNDKGFWREVYNCQKPYEMRNLLIRQSHKCIKAGREPIIRFEPFLEIFEEGEELVRVDWKLAWDLMLIRVIEQLYDKKWFDKNKEVLELEDTRLIKQEV